jgi:hypothetical protein
MEPLTREADVLLGHQTRTHHRVRTTENAPPRTHHRIAPTESTQAGVVRHVFHSASPVRLGASRCDDIYQQKNDDNRSKYQKCQDFSDETEQECE